MRKMDVEKAEAEMKFWEIPELVEKLVALLDPLSTTCLAQSGVVKTDIFQKSMSSEVWKHFIRQSSTEEYC